MEIYNATRFKNFVRGLLRYLTSKAWIRSCFFWLSRAGLLPEGIWRRLPVDYIFPVTLPDGVFFMYHSFPSDNIGRALYWKGLASWEAETIPFFYQFAKNSRIVLDIGLIRVFTPYWHALPTRLLKFFLSNPRQKCFPAS